MKTVGMLSENMNIRGGVCRAQVSNLVRPTPPTYMSQIYNVGVNYQNAVKQTKWVHHSSAPVLTFCVFVENILIIQHYFIKHFKSTQPIRALPKEWN